MKNNTHGAFGYYPVPPYQYKPNYADVTGHSRIWSKNLSRQTISNAVLTKKKNNDSPFFLNKQVSEFAKEDKSFNIPMKENSSISSTPIDLPFWVPRPPLPTSELKNSSTTAETLLSHFSTDSCSKTKAKNTVSKTGSCSDCDKKQNNTFENMENSIPMQTRKQYYAQNHAVIHRSFAPLQKRAMSMPSLRSNEMRMGNQETKPLPSNLNNKRMQANTFSTQNFPLMRTANNSFNQVSRPQESGGVYPLSTTDTENLGDGALINYIKLLEQQYAQACAQPPAKSDCCCCGQGQNQASSAPASASPNGSGTQNASGTSGFMLINGRLVNTENGVPVSFVEEEAPEYIPGYNPNPGPAYTEYVPGVGWTMKNL